MGNEQRFAAPGTGEQARLRSLEMRKAEVERRLEHLPTGWSPARVRAEQELKGIERELRSVRRKGAPSPLARQGANEARSRVLRIGGREYLAPPGSGSRTTTSPAVNEAEREPVREPWKSPPVRVENAANGGRWETRFVEVLAGSASDEVAEPVPYWK